MSGKNVVPAADGAPTPLDGVKFCEIPASVGLFDEEIELLLSAKGLGIELSRMREAKETDELGV